jgi:hypothetical protein
MEEGVVFPPVRVWFDNSHYWLSDGFHRLAAAARIGLSRFPAYICDGSLSDALWDSYSANSLNGRARSAAERKAIILGALVHPDSAGMSNVQLARTLGLPEATLRRYRNCLSSSRDEDGQARLRTVNRQGTTYVLRIGNLGSYSRRSASKARSVLKSELAQMRSSSSPAARRILAVVEHWALGSATAQESIAALEQVLCSSKAHNPSAISTHSNKT